MVHVTVQGDKVLFEVKGLHKLWALKSRFEVPRSEILDVRKDPAAARAPKGWRVPGTYIPGLITAGTYYRKGKRTFCDVCSPDDAVALTLGNARYNRLIVEVEDPDGVVRSLAG